MPEHDSKAVCYFQGEAVETIAAQLQQYGPSTARLFVLRHGDEYFLQVKAESGDGEDPTNSSHPCPGSPGCP